MWKLSRMVPVVSKGWKRRIVESVEGDEKIGGEIRVKTAVPANLKPSRHHHVPRMFALLLTPQS
jgi:hypothetical protein